MKISELESLLKTAREVVGDIEVVQERPDGYMQDITHVEVLQNAQRCILVMS